MPFLDRLLPSEGHICVAMLLPQGGFRHFFFETLPEAQTRIDLLEQSGQTVYLAQARFKTDDNRKQENALYLRNFFFDIDCGDGKDYPDQRTAAQALKAFVAETGLPFPSVVSSGNGLYAHWLIEENIPQAQWKTVARILKKVADAYGFKTDPMRTADSASVLRPPGTTNRKPGKAPKPVNLVVEKPATKFLEFARLLSLAAKKKQVDISAVQPPKPVADINAEFYAGVEIASVPSDPQRCADKCRQIGLFKSERGNLSEPLWYAGLGVLVFCENGAEVCHEWSQGHADYSPAETTEKIEHRLASGTGPTTCAYFGSLNPTGCIGCPHNGKIKSPIVLGRPEPKAKPVADPSQEPPPGFRRTESGLFFEEEGRWVAFYDQDLYPVRIAFDESLGHETTTVRHYLPHEGWLEFSYRSSLVNDPKGFATVFCDNHVKVVGKKEKNAMLAYMESYTQKLQRQRRMTALFCQMGWKEYNSREMFVLGQTVYTKDGRESAALARNVPQAALGYRTQGDVALWAAQTEKLRGKEMMPFAFALLAGGFGAPLMKFTGYDGALVSMVGESGAGKTLMLRMIQSVWGYHNDLMMLRDDTRNSLMARLGVYGNLPLTIDEITNIDGMELSDLVYRVTQGRDKVRLTKSAEERRNLNTWNTLAVVSTNASLAEKLASAKHDAGAELNRIFEYTVPRVEAFSRDITTELYWTIDQNYGHAGERYAQWLIKNKEKIKPGLEKVRALVEKEAGIRNEERYWAAVASTAIYGGLVAQALGLIRFEVSPLIAWVAEVIREMRGDKAEFVADPVAVLGLFIDEHQHNRLVLEDSSSRLARMIDQPKGSLVMRLEADKKKLYISRAAFTQWLKKRHGNYGFIKNDFIYRRIMPHNGVKKVLGAGTPYGGVQQFCLEIDLTNPALGICAVQLVLEAQMAAAAFKEG